MKRDMRARRIHEVASASRAVHDDKIKDPYLEFLTQHGVLFSKPSRYGDSGSQGHAGAGHSLSMSRWIACSSRNAGARAKWHLVS